MKVCSCGARLVEGARWCAVCLRPPIDPDDLIEELHDTFRKTTWLPPEHLVAPPPPKRFSRWQAGPLTFGPRFKVGVTILLSLVTLDWLWSIQPWTLFRHPSSHPEGPFIIFSTLLLLAIVTVFLRAVWKRERVE